VSWRNAIDSIVASPWLRVSITTVKSADTVRIEVRDTGNGLSSIERTGLGIANVRNRIGLLFGDKGRLSMEENIPHGVRTIIEVPKNGL
jgi:LytS/YehU family sensor histidine kinase